MPKSDKTASRYGSEDYSELCKIAGEKITKRLKELRALLIDTGTHELPQEQDAGHGGPQEKRQKSSSVQALVLPQGQPSWEASPNSS